MTEQELLNRIEEQAIQIGELKMQLAQVIEIGYQLMDETAKVPQFVYEQMIKVPVNFTKPCEYCTLATQLIELKITDVSKQ